MKFNIPMLVNSSGKSSASFTMVFISFNIICLWLILYILCPLFGNKDIPQFNGTEAMLFLSPLLMNYFFGKNTLNNIDNK